MLNRNELEILKTLVMTEQMKADNIKAYSVANVYGKIWLELYKLQGE